MSMHNLHQQYRKAASFLDIENDPAFIAELSEMPLFERGDVGYFIAPPGFYLHARHEHLY